MAAASSRRARLLNLLLLCSAGRLAVGLAGGGGLRLPGLLLLCSTQLTVSLVELHHQREPEELRLPGYTGWARPDGEGRAGSFELRTAALMSGPLAPGAHSFSAVSGLGAGAKLFVRLLGPAIVHAQTVDQGDGVYNITMNLLDPGDYTVEVVLEYFAPLPYPAAFASGSTPAYEGRHVTGSPFKVSVVGSHPPSPGRLCKFSGEPAAQEGRWIVQDPVGFSSLWSRSGGDSQKWSQLDGAARDALEVRYGEMGFSWAPFACRVAAPRDLDPGNDASNDTFLMVGDSTVDLQVLQWARDSLPGRVSYFDTSNGIRIRRPALEADIAFALRHTDMGKPRTLMFNSGLHDIDRYCSKEWEGWRRETGFPELRAPNFDCIANYKKEMATFADALKALQDKYQVHLVYRTTTAAWQKWGNWGFDWPDGPQSYISSTYSTEYFNRLAEPIFRDRGFDVIDAWASSIGRPDHTQRESTGRHEVREGGQIGGHLVHHGPQVVRLQNSLLFQSHLMHWLA